MQFFSGFQQKLYSEFNYTLNQNLSKVEDGEDQVVNLLALQQEAEKCDVLLNQYQTRTEESHDREPGSQVSHGYEKTKHQVMFDVLASMMDGLGELEAAHEKQECSEKEIRDKMKY